VLESYSQSSSLNWYPVHDHDFVVWVYKPSWVDSLAAEREECDSCPTEQFVTHQCLQWVQLLSRCLNGTVQTASTPRRITASTRCRSVAVVKLHQALPLACVRQFGDDNTPEKCLVSPPGTCHDLAATACVDEAKFCFFCSVILLWRSSITAGYLSQFHCVTDRQTDRPTNSSRYADALRGNKTYSAWERTEIYRLRSTSHVECGDVDCGHIRWAWLHQTLETIG